MIYAIGLGTDKTMQHFLAASADQAQVTHIDMNEAFYADWCFALEESGPSARSSQFGELDPQAGYYVRPVDLSPVLIQPWDNQWRAMLAGLSSYLECVSGRVVNRPGGHTHNGAKPLHEAWLQQRGFDIPLAITTSDKERIKGFIAEHGEVICKSLCGVRARARLVSLKDFDDYRSSQGPVHLQHRITGDDVRVHLVGEHAHGERIRADGIDYRDRDVDSVHEPISVADDLVSRMCESARNMQLAFTGWDFKIDSEGRWWCLEVNPMPGYDSYDRRCGGAITRSIVSWLGHA